MPALTERRAEFRDGARSPSRADIYPVFRELFAKPGEQGSARDGRSRASSRSDHALDPAALLFDGAEWDFELIHRVYDAIEDDRAATSSGSTSFPTRSR